MFADENTFGVEVADHRVSVTAVHFQVEVSHVLAFDCFEVRAVELKNLLACFGFRQAVDAVLWAVLRLVALKNIVAVDISKELDTALVIVDSLEATVRFTRLDESAV